MNEQGVAQTAALPKPNEIMTKSFRRGLDAVVRADPQGVEDALAKAEEQFFDIEMAPPDVAAEAPFVGLPPPVKILRGPIVDAEGVTAGIARVDERWRLDVILALEDYTE